ncbi:zinc-binding dehydrogenase [Streptomyces sp. NPDC005805]|uniref:zinc-binding dehydrogenase n=1 Tax=Streptomyces sp. NPDC005805 TaxID=3157068 RepID=UPI0033DB450D
MPGVVAPAKIRRTPPCDTGLDLAFDGAGGDLGRAVFETVAPGGRFVTYDTSDGGFTEIPAATAGERGVRVTNALKSGPPAPAAVHDLLTRALALTARGRLRPAIGATYPLARAAEAHGALARRATVGKSLLLP